MGRVIRILDASSMEGVEIIRDKETLESIDKVSQLIDGLLISINANNDLVNAMLEMCQLMECNAYKQGFDLGLKLSNFK